MESVERMGVWKIVLVVLLSMTVAVRVGYVWWRYQRKEADELVPAWLRQQLGKSGRGALRGSGRHSEEGLLSNAQQRYPDEE